MEALQIKRTPRRVSPRKLVMQQLRLRLGFERGLRIQLFNLFKEIGDDAASQVENYGSFQLDVQRIRDRFRDILEPFLTQVIEEFGTLVLDQQKALPIFDRMVKEYMRTHAAQAVTNISRTTYERIRRSVARGELESMGPSNTAKLIRDEFGGQFSRSRAATIARTEVHNATTWSQMEVAREQLDQDGLMKQWVSVGDGRTRSHHRAANGLLVDIDDKFELNVGGISYFMDRPGDPLGGPANVINCRCAVVFVYPEDIVDSEEVQTSKDPWLYKDKIQPNYDPEEWANLGVYNLERTSGYQQDFGLQYGLSDLELETLVTYTGFGYNGLNRRMRDWFFGTRRVTDEVKAAIIGVNKTLADALRKLPAYEGVSTRGISINSDDLLDWVANNDIKAGSIYRTESVFSTAAGVKGFAGNVKFEIQGKHGRYIDEISEHQGEQEVLFPAGHEFRIDKVEITGEGTNRSVRIFMTDINDGLKQEDVNIAQQEERMIGRELSRVMQSEAPLASVNTILLKSS